MRQGHFLPVERIEITLVNTLPFDRVNCPLIISRDRMPIQDLHEMWVTFTERMAANFE